MELHPSTTPSPQPSEKLSALLKKPLITGASVSADWSSFSPGKKLALRYTGRDDIRMEAQGGRMGRETVKRIHESTLKDRALVLGLDLFFWDSTDSDFEPSIKAMHKIMQQVSAQNIPIVLGEIPELLPGRQRFRDQLNAAIHESCKAYEKCFIMPFDELHQQLKRDGYLMIQGKKFTQRDIVPDGLHLSEPAGDYLSEILKKVLEK